MRAVLDEHVEPDTTAVGAKLDDRADRTVHAGSNIERRRRWLRLAERIGGEDPRPLGAAAVRLIDTATASAVNPALPFNEVRSTRTFEFGPGLPPPFAYR